MNDPRILTKPFAEWPSEMRRAYLEGWSVATIGTGKSERDVMNEAEGNAHSVLLGAAWNMGRNDAREGTKRDA